MAQALLSYYPQCRPKTFAKFQPSGDGGTRSPPERRIACNTSLPDSSIPSMRTANIQNSCEVAPKWPRGSGKVGIPSFGRFGQLSLNKFFDPIPPSMRKGRDGGEKNLGGKGGVKMKKK